MEFRLGETYNDKGSKSHKDDQFMRYLDNGFKTIPNSGGVRRHNYKHINIKKKYNVTIPPYVILMTAETRVSWANPWSDIVDYESGQIKYWGDDKNETPKKNWDEFRGNKLLWAIFELTKNKEVDLIPPILHFIKTSSGKVKFSGLCLMNNCSLDWYFDGNEPISNLKVVLDILELEKLDIRWLKERSLESSQKDLLKNSPEFWRNAMKGKAKKLRVWSSEIKTKNQQFPMSTHPDFNIIESINKLNPYQFEALTKLMVEDFSDIIDGLTHSVTQTKKSGDKGIDIYGYFRLPEPINYKIKFKGEAKRWTGAVGPKDVSRLVARLQRGEYGLFFTTSWYTIQAQEEVIIDGYPVRLFSGQDIVNILKSLKKITKGKIDKSWLKSITS